MHYVARGSADGYYPRVCRAAVITEVDYHSVRNRVSLCVLNPSGIFFHENCEHAETSEYPEGMEPGSWHWPERVE